MSFLDPGRAVPTAADNLQRDLFAVAASARRRMALVVIVLASLAVATAAALVVKAVGGV